MRGLRLSSNDGTGSRIPSVIPPSTISCTLRVKDTGLVDTVKGFQLWINNFHFFDIQNYDIPLRWRELLAYERTMSDNPGAEYKQQNAIERTAFQHGRDHSQREKKIEIYNNTKHQANYLKSDGCQLNQNLRQHHQNIFRENLSLWGHNKFQTNIVKIKWTCRMGLSPFCCLLLLVGSNFRLWLQDILWDD